MELINELFEFYEDYKEEKGFIGFSVKGCPIPYFAVKNGGFPVAVLTGAIHAREYVTGYVLLKEIGYLKTAVFPGKVYVIPVVNPDGVKVVKSVKNYKANANGVDLNANFPARYGTGEKNVKRRGFSDYIGKYPLSEEESKALYYFTESANPDFTLSLHTKGEEIYYDFYDEFLAKRDYKYALIAEKLTGYKVVKNLPSAGGYKDLCVGRYKIPSLTTECGSDDLIHPIDKSHADEIFGRIKDIPPEILKEIYRDKNGRKES